MVHQTGCVQQHIVHLGTGKDLHALDLYRALGEQVVRLYQQGVGVEKVVHALIAQHALLEAAALRDSRSSGRLTTSALAVQQLAVWSSASMEHRKLIHGMPTAVPMRIKVMPTAISRVTMPQIGVIVRHSPSAISVE